MGRVCLCVIRGLGLSYPGHYNTLSLYYVVFRIYFRPLTHHSNRARASYSATRNRREHVSVMRGPHVGGRTVQSSVLQTVIIINCFCVLAANGLDVGRLNNVRPGYQRTAALSVSAPSKENKNIYLHPSASIVQISETERGIRIVGEDGIRSNGEVLLSVPLEQIILSERGRDETPVGRAIAEKLALAPPNTIVDEDDERTYLTLWLCHALYKRRQQQKRNSGGKGDDGGNCGNNNDNQVESLREFECIYLDTLPKDVANLPVFWDESDLAYLHGSRVRNEALQKRVEWTTLYNKIVTEYAPYPKWAEEETSLQDFLYARALVETRAFRLRRSHFEDLEEQRVKRPFGLVPFADMLNHRSRSHPATCDWCFEEDSQTFVIRTSNREGLNKGDEAALSYGLHSNSHYLSCYGFALEENCRHDGASPDEAHIDVLLEGTLCSFTLMIGNKDASEALLSKLRISVATEEEKEELTIVLHNALSRRPALSSAISDENKGSKEGHLACPLPRSLRNERAAMTKLHRSVLDAIGRYETKLEEDIELLSDEKSFPAFSNRRNAVLVRSGEKRILRHWRFLCDAALIFLSDVEEEKMEWSVYCDVLDATLGRLMSIAP